MPASDPKGYYAALGLRAGADADDIKAAYRALAKRLHPDAGGGDAAAFARVAEAYHVLGDPARRLEYDAGAGHGAPSGRPLRCGRCGRVSAQPRVVGFEEIRARLLRIERRRVGGVLCRACAEHVALQASAVTWLCGWWALQGPAASVAALYRNARGGTMPPDDNLALLLRQAEGFRDAGHAPLARAVLDQARGFAGGRHGQAIAMLAATLPAPTLRLRDRWRRPGWPRLLHLLPPAALLLGLSAALAWAG